MLEAGQATDAGHQLVVADRQASALLGVRPGAGAGVALQIGTQRLQFGRGRQVGLAQRGQVGTGVQELRPQHAASGVEDLDGAFGIAGTDGPGRGGAGQPGPGRERVFLVGPVQAKPGDLRQCGDRSPS